MGKGHFMYVFEHNKYWQQKLLYSIFRKGLKKPANYPHIVDKRLTPPPPLLT